MVCTDSNIDMYSINYVSLKTNFDCLAPCMTSAINLKIILMLASQVINVNICLALYCHKTYRYHLPVEPTDCGDDGWPIGVDNINVARRMRKEAGISELVPGR